MKRRTRPLDETEYRSVDADKPLGVELLRDTTDYSLKWPDAPLSRLLQRGATGGKKDAAGGGVQVPLCSKDALATPITINLPPRTAATSSTRAASSMVASGPALVFTLPPRWRFALGAKARTDAQQLALEAQVVALERAAAAQLAKTSLSMQRLLTLPTAVPRGDATDTLLYRLWIGDRLHSRSADRPWGVPLVTALFEATDLDEYFLSTKDYGAEGQEGTKKDGQPRRSAAADRRAGLQNGPRGGNQFDFLPFEMPNLKLTGPLFRNSARSRERDNEQAAAVIAALPGSLRSTKLASRRWGVGDLLDEVAGLRQARLLDDTDAAFP